MEPKPMRVACPACGTCFGVNPKKKVDHKGEPTEWHWEAEIVETPGAGLFPKPKPAVTRVNGSQVECENDDSSLPAEE